MKLQEKLRPYEFNQIIGQHHLLNNEALINNLIQTESSILLYGPPGVGKTTFAKIYAKKLNANYHELSSIFTTTAQLKEIFAKSQEKGLLDEKTVIFIDEIHRFNKNQQDLFLPVIESGQIILVACTTENPSFALNNALISRCQTLQFKKLTSQDLLILFNSIEKTEGHLALNHEQLDYLIINSNSDARIFIANLEKLYALNFDKISDEELASILQTTPFKSDKKGDVHYDYFSAFQKSIRGSDDASAMLYFTKMVENGEDVSSIARRMLIIAAEDVGLADPQALIQVNTAIQAFERVGLPEGLIIMAQAINYLALAPKSNASYKSLKLAKQLIKENRDIYPPKVVLETCSKTHIANGNGVGYIYDHDTENGFAGQDFFPKDMPRIQLYQPKQVGFERDLAKRLEYFTNIRNKNK
jgi:putative ATPase